MSKHFFILFLVLFFISPRLNGGVRLDDFLIFLFFITVFIYLLLKRKVTISRLVIIYGLFVIYSGFMLVYGLINGVDYKLGLITFVKYFSYLIILHLSYVYARSSAFDMQLVISIVVFLIASNTVWQFYQVFTSSYSTFWGVQEASSYGIKMVGEGAAFQVGAVLAFSSLFILLVCATTHSFLVRVSFLIWYFFLLYFLFLTQSRINLFSGLLSACIIIFYYRIRFRFLLLTMPFIILGSLFYLSDVVSEVFVLSSRFSLYGVRSALAVRVDEIWGDVLDIIDQNLIFGVGLGGISLINRDNTEVHNFYLKLMLEGGVIYSLLFYTFLLSSFFKAKRCIMTKNFVELSFLTICMMFCLMLGGAVQDSFSSTKAVVPLLVCIGILSGLSVKERYESFDSRRGLSK